MSCSLRSRCLEVMGTRKNRTGVRGRQTKGEGAPDQEVHEYRFYLVSESLEDSYWLRGSRRDKCFL